MTGESKFVEKYEGLTDLDKLTAELSADLLHSVKIWPDGRVNVELNYLDEIPHAVVRDLLAAIYFWEVIYVRKEIPGGMLLPCCHQSKMMIRRWRPKVSICVAMLKITV